MVLDKCCVCLGSCNVLNTKLTKTQHIEKLRFLAPEAEWLEAYSICLKCDRDLDSAYTFKKLCLSNSDFRNQSKSEYKRITCEETLLSQALVEAHVTQLHENEKKRTIKQPHKFRCDECNKDFALLKNIIEHCMDSHSMTRPQIKPYRCEECDHKFTTCTLLIQHKKYHKAARNFVCTACGKTFITKRDLSGHEKLHSNERKYGCDKCEKSFNTSQNLKTHIYVVHTDSSQWKYSCPVCSKRFAMKTNCNEHIKRHKGDKNYACHICAKTFVSNHELKKHVKLHSNVALKCKHCPKMYRDKRSLNVHLARLHGIGTVKRSQREKKFFCHICPSQFFDNTKLQRHICTHTGVKPFSCDECDKRFNDRSYLNHHLKSVHKLL